MEIAETVGELLGEVCLEQFSGVGAIDAGAEEELFRRVGQQAAAELLVKRWQEADDGAIVQCEQCRESMRPLGRRKKTLQTVCGTVEIMLFSASADGCRHCHDLICAKQSKHGG